MYRIHYNFVRNHGSIDQMPAKKEGIKLELGQNKITIPETNRVILSEYLRKARWRNLFLKFSYELIKVF